MFEGIQRNKKPGKLSHSLLDLIGGAYVSEKLRRDCKTHFLKLLIFS